MLGSFFELVLTAITDPKDDKAIRIKSNPAYLADPSYWTRAWVTTNWKKWAR